MAIDRDSPALPDLAADAPLPDVPARLLRRRLRDQPVDGPRTARRRRRPGGRASGNAARTPTSGPGHVVETINPRRRACPTWCSPPTARLVIDGVASARPVPRTPSGAGEERRLRGGSERTASTCDAPSTCNEGEGDFARRRRRDPRPAPASAPRRAHREVGAHLRPRGRDARAGRPALLPPRHRAVRARPRPDRVLPGRVLRCAAAPSSGGLFPDAVSRRPSDDAAAFGCNAVCDGTTCSCRPAPTTWRRALTARGFAPVPVDLSELRKAGGSVKCCTLELPRRSGMTIETTHRSLPRTTTHPLPVTLVDGEGAWVSDVDGRRYLDCLAGVLGAELRAPPPARSSRPRTRSSTGSR